MSENQIDEALQWLDRLELDADGDAPLSGSEWDAAMRTIRQALERQRLPETCQWCSGPGPLNAEGLCVKCLYPDGPPKGWKLVPVKPTEEMLLEGERGVDETFRGTKDAPMRSSVRNCYVYALAAAPEPDNGGDDV